MLRSQALVGALLLVSKPDRTAATARERNNVSLERSKERRPGRRPQQHLRKMRRKTITSLADLRCPRLPPTRRTRTTMGARQSHHTIRFQHLFSFPESTARRLESGSRRNSRNGRRWKKQRVRKKIESSRRCWRNTQTFEL